MKLRSVLTLALLTLAASCSKPRQPNVLLVVVDTLRSDHLPDYGYQVNNTTPFLSAQVVQGDLQVYDGLVATSSWTKPSVATIFSGLEPTEHNVMRLVGKGSKFKVSDTLAQKFSDAGYATSCVQSNFLLTRAMGAGYDRGFDDYFDAIGAKKDPHRGSTANDVAQTGLSWINKLDGEQPWFLVLHFFDPHASFEDHPQVDWLDPNYSGWVTGGISTDELRKREKDCTPEDIRALGSFYDEEILAVDNGIKLFVEGLDSSQWQQTVMLLTSDHGEELGERQHIGHTQTLMTELVDVPLMVRVPPQFSKSWQLPESKNGGYAMTQIYPALLNVSGIEVPSSRSLFAPDVLKSQVDFAPVRVEHVEKYVQKVAIRKGDLHMIADQRQGTVAMFDLSADPQMQNLLPSSHPQFSSMVDLLQAQKWWPAK